MSNLIEGKESCEELMSNLIEEKRSEELVTTSPSDVVQHSSETTIQTVGQNHIFSQGISMSLRIADNICNGAISFALSKNISITVVVVDSSNHPIVSKRMDACPPTGMPQFALAKASTCISMNMSSRNFRDRYTSSADPSRYCQMLSMVNITGGMMAPFPGGILIRRKEDGSIVGAIGVSGGNTPDEDEECALSGALASGLLGFAREGWVTEPTILTSS